MSKKITRNVVGLASAAFIGWAAYDNYKTTGNPLESKPIPKTPEGSETDKSAREIIPVIVAYPIVLLLVSSVVFPKATKGITDALFK